MKYNLYRIWIISIYFNETLYDRWKHFRFLQTNRERSEVTKKNFAGETIWKVIKTIPVGSYTIKIFDLGDSTSYTIALSMKSTSWERELTSKKVERNKEKIDSYVTYLKKVYITNSI